MAGGIGVELTGFDELARQLKGIGANVPTELGAAGEKGMLVLEGAIKERAPVKTGNLRDSYNTEVRQVGLGVEVTTGTNVEYGPAMEYGPRPHVRPALDAVGDQVIATVTAELRRVIGA